MYRFLKNYFSSLVLLLLLLLASQTNAFGRPRSHKQHNSRNAVETKNDCSHHRALIKNASSVEKSPEPTDLDPYYNNCGLVGFGVVQKIPYRITPSDGPLEVNLSSACIRCGICIAIVERINQSLLNAHDIMDANQWFNETETHHFLGAICDHGFRHYALREIDGERFIGDGTAIPGATSVTSNIDGHWESTLKNKCHEILDEIGYQQLYKYWQDWCNDGPMAKSLIELLCRNADSGRLRDCQNIDCDATKFPAAADDLCRQSFFDWQARVKVSAELSSE